MSTYVYDSVEGAYAYGSYARYHEKIDIYQWLREVCLMKLLATPIVLGGPGKVVRIDDFLITNPR